jgi:hypothetical protein
MPNSRTKESLNSDSLPMVWDFATDGNLLGAIFTRIMHEQKHCHLLKESWPCELDALPDGFEPDYSTQGGQEGGFKALQVFDKAVVWVNVSYGTCWLNASSATIEDAREAIEKASEFFPVYKEDDPVTIPVSFWAYGNDGPYSVRRNVDAPLWSEIAKNYNKDTALQLADLMVDDFRPGRRGQLILWHGEPGSGKTTALRALAQSWRKWARIHYITDPEKFFGKHADYMLQVMLGRDDIPNDSEDGKEESPWRVLILEDSGELLAADAKQQTGQSLSRFLNAVDGLIGQGLRVMTLVTSNEELGAYHPAVVRNGRAAAEIEFEKLSEEESVQWLMDEGLEEEEAIKEAGSGLMLADLYAKAEHRDRDREQHSGKKVGFAASD